MVVMHRHENIQQPAALMQLVMYACLPGLLALIWFFGWGHLINLIWAGLLALGFEALALKLRQRCIKASLSDGSALVTALLLALALPPFCPWWATMLAVGFAILIGKQLFGGLGYNPFNPAMLGYVFLLVSFPLIMTTWATPKGINTHPIPGFFDTLQIIFLPSQLSLDALTMPTTLDVFKFREGLSIAETWHTQAGFGHWGGFGWEWVNAAFLTGGLWLIYQRAFSWHAPAGMLGTIAFCALIFYDGGSSESHGSPLFHLFSGGTMLGAFYIVTDPVSGATSRQGRLVFGIGAGLLIFLIRAFGGYPDAIAFAVLIMNMVAPLIDLGFKTTAASQAIRVTVDEAQDE